MIEKRSISENSMKSNSPTKFVQNHIDHFIYYDFCKQFIEDFKDQEESSSTLQKALKAIIKGKSNTKAFKEKAEIILKDIKVTAIATKKKKKKNNKYVFNQ
jgi:hypothetical protein